jgi:tetratricopeptide (TPR) repeat protein
LTSARRLQATSDFRTAEEVIREAIEAAPESANAWDALERLKTTQRDFQGVAKIRQERLAQNPPGPREEASLRKLELRLAEGGEEGYWSWRMEDLQDREERGEKISPVILARAFMGLDRADEAFRELEAAVEERDRNLISLWTDPAWDSVRTDPRFRKIMMDIRRTQSSKGTRFPGWH